MDNSLCQAISEWIHQTGNGGEREFPVARFAAHIAECDHCRVALQSVLAKTKQALAVDDISCDTCQDGMAMYIDRERDKGTHVAVTVYPKIWWHLIECSDCLTTYKLTHVLLEAERDGSLSSLQDIMQSALHHPTNSAAPELTNGSTQPDAGDLC
jgi:predicted anti-sigma-YlaC factor YlaD